MIYPFKKIWPKIHETAFIAPSADIIGDVVIGEYSSVWFQVVIRGDVNDIRIGNRTNIQDHSMLHVTRKTSPLRIGDEVTIGHRVMVHGCTVGDRILIGMGAILMDDCVIGDDCIIGAGALVTKGFQVPAGSVVFGSPSKVIRPINEQERAFLKKSAENYVGDAHEYYSYMRGPKRFDAAQLDVDLRNALGGGRLGGMGGDDEEDIF